MTHNSSDAGDRIFKFWGSVPKVASASAGMVLTAGQTAYIVVPELISSTLVKPNPSYDPKCKYIFFIFKTIQHVKEFITAADGFLDNEQPGYIAHHGGKHVYCTLYYTN